MNNDNILEFFHYLNQLTKQTITQIEMTPNNIGDNTYISGFRVLTFNSVEAHIKKTKPITQLNNTNTITTTTPTTIKDYVTTIEIPQEDIFLNTKFLEQTIVNTTLTELKTKFYQLNNIFEIVILNYKNEKTKQVEYHAIIYDNKRTACKQTLDYKKTHPNTIHKIIHFGQEQQNKQQNEITELDIVTSPIEDNE